MPDKGSNVFDECAAEFDECAAEYLCPQGNSVATGVQFREENTKFKETVMFNLCKL